MEKRKLALLAGSSRELGLIIFILALVVLIQILNPKFLTPANINDILVNTAVLSILSVGMMMVMITGGIDLSVGAVVALSGMVASLTVRDHPLVPVPVLILESVAVGALVGAVIGVLIARFEILPIIATLGIMYVARGLTFIVAKGSWVSAYQMPANFKDFATSRFLGINHLVVFAIIVYLLFYVFINYTRTGRHIYAVGSSADSASIAGLPSRRIKFIVYVLMGALAGLAGILWVTKYASAQGDTATGYEMKVIAACVIGGVSVTGGRGKVFGLLLGVILFGILANALPLLNISEFWQNGVQGFVILFAVVGNVIIKRNNDRAVLHRRVI